MCFRPSVSCSSPGKRAGQARDGAAPAEPTAGAQRGTTCGTGAAMLYNCIHEITCQYNANTYIKYVTCIVIVCIN